MKNKIALTILIAVLLALIFATSGFAAPADPDAANAHRRGQRGVGQVVEATATSLTISAPSGEEKTFTLAENTRYRTPSGEEAGPEDLTPERWVIVVVGRRAQGSESGTPTARAVVILPEDFEPDGRFAKRAFGEIAALDPAAGTLSLTTFNGETLTFGTDEDTRYLGQIDGLADLEIGDKIAVASRETEDGVLIATVIAHGQRPRRAAGEVTAVGTDSFTLVTRNGEERTIFVDENTRFRGRDGEIEGLDDLEPGMHAFAHGQIQEDGSLLARLVIAGNTPEE